MSTADTKNIGIKLQAAGENLNTWGDPNLNNDFIVVSNLSSRWNPLTINVGATTTISETNYSTSNDTEVAVLKLVAGTIAAAFELVIPSRAKRLLVWNATGYACTIKLAATTGFAIPTGRIAWAATDGSTDVLNLTANYGGVAVPTGGSTDIPAWSAVEAAIAAAGLPATSGTVLNSGTDPSANYLANKIAAVGALSIATTNGGTANEKSTFTVGALGLTAGAPQTTSFSPAVNTRYTLTKSGNVTVTMPAAPTARDVIQVEIGGTSGVVTYGLNGLKFYGSTTNPTSSAEGVQTFIYHSAARGWIDQ